MFMNKHKILNLLKSEMVPALGVTEPATIALSTARAYQKVRGKIISIKLELDPGIYKNSYACSIPSTNHKGIRMAALLGAINGQPDLGLEVLDKITDQDIKTAQRLNEKKDIVQIKIKEGVKGIYCSSTVETEQGSAKVVIEESHDNIVYIEHNDQTVYEEKNKKKVNSNNNKLCIEFTELSNFVDKLSYDEVKFSLTAVEMNHKLASKGVKDVGLGVGYQLNELLKDGHIKNDLVNNAKRLTAYAVDARMGGVPLPAMSFCGSGDHGIIATLPLKAVETRKQIGKKRLAKSIILSYLITYYLKNKTGKLSAYCGCAVAAGTGASAGITYLLNGTQRQIEGAINNMAGNITGMICDGGNFGCSLKAATAAGAAVESALFAIQDHYLRENTGIVGKSIKETLDNMAKIATPGMNQTNDVILEILKNREVED